MNISRKFVTVKNLKLDIKRIFFKKLNNISPIVLLHEGLGCIELWKNWPEKLAEETGKDIIIYSRLGMGMSDKIKQKRKKNFMHEEGYIFLPNIIKQLNLKKPILFGHSDGASIAMLCAGKKNNLAALILEAPHVFVEKKTILEIKKLKKIWNNSNLKEKLTKYHDDVDGAFTKWIDVWLSEDFLSWNIENDLKNIKIPTLVIQGKNDQYGTLEQVSRIKEKLDFRLETLILDNCRHSPHFDQPDAVIFNAKNFLMKNSLL